MFGATDPNFSGIFISIVLITVSIIALVWRGRMDEADAGKCGKTPPSCVQGGDTFLYVLIVTGVVIGILYALYEMGILGKIASLIQNR